MKDTLKNRIISTSVMMVITIGAIVLLVMFLPDNRAESNTCNQILKEIKSIEVVNQIIEKEVFELDEWECEWIESSYTDLLQPSGLFGIKNARCIKLEQTIEEWYIQYPERIPKQK